MEYEELQQLEETYSFKINHKTILHVISITYAILIAHYASFFVWPHDTDMLVIRNVILIVKISAVEITRFIDTSFILSLAIEKPFRGFCFHCHYIGPMVPSSAFGIFKG